MRYAIRYRCGHEAEVNVYGKKKERERKLDLIKNRECVSCRARHETEHGYAALDGNEREVEWGMDIRQAILSMVSKRFTEEAMGIRHSEESGEITTEERDRRFQESDTRLIPILDGLMSETSSDWFLGRYKTGEDAVMKAVEDRYL